MSGKTISRRRFLRDGAALLLTGAACLWGSDLLAPMPAYADEVDESSLSIVRDVSKCIGCGKCVEMCTGRQGLDILELREIDGKTVSALKYTDSLQSSKCIGCGQCARHCPSGAITVKDALSTVLKALSDTSYEAIVWQFAPSAQHIIGEEFHMLPGTDVCKKLSTATRALDSRSLCFSTDFGADITIMEEASELVKRLQSNDSMPMMTSCCPGWVNYVELHHPEIIPHLSSCKSPMEMLASLIRNYLPEQKGIAKEKIFHIAVMPCTAKKYERSRYTGSVDAVLTVLEFKNLLMQREIDLGGLDDGEYDELFSGTSGAGRIFGATGGVCEAAMRTAHYLLTGADAQPIEFTALRGSDGIKTANIQIGERTIRACVVNGIANISQVIQDINSGNSPYDFIEVMACRGGCSGGGGTPVLFGDEGVRHRGLYQYDSHTAVRASHQNTVLDHIYTSYLDAPGSEKAEALLHTSYTNRSGA